MVVLVFFILELLLVLVQTTLTPFLPQAFGQPHLIFILVAFISYRFNWLSGIWLIFIMGWMLDVVSSLYMGVYPVHFLIVFVILKLIASNSPLKEDTYQIPLTAVLYLGSQLILSFLFSQLMSSPQPLWSWVEIVQDTIVLLIATIPCFLFFSLLFERFSKRRAPLHILRRARREDMDI